jgi:predicted lipoprotein with Yx(FWY)xxD motif
VNRAVYALSLLVALAVGVAGCGGGGSTSSDGTEPSRSTIAVVSADSVGDLGTILVDAEGRTLYIFHKDRSTKYVGLSSACYGACTKSWQPLLTGGEPAAEGGAIDTKLGTLKRKDGTLQVTYYGHPLYTYVGDRGPGEASGNDVKAFDGEWSTLRPNDQKPN